MGQQPDDDDEDEDGGLKDNSKHTVAADDGEVTGRGLVIHDDEGRMNIQQDHCSHRHHCQNHPVLLCMCMNIYQMSSSIQAVLNVDVDYIIRHRKADLPKGPRPGRKLDK